MSRSGHWDSPFSCVLTVVAQVSVTRFQASLWVLVFEMHRPPLEPASLGPVKTSGPAQPARSLHWVWGPGPGICKGYLALLCQGTSSGGITVGKVGSLTVGPPNSRLATQRFLRGPEEVLLPCRLGLGSSPRHLRAYSSCVPAFLSSLPSP